MQILEIDPSNWEQLRKPVIAFVKKQGDGRITHKAIRWLRDMASSELDQDGTVLLAAIDNRKIIGFIAISDYGKDQSIVVVHKDFRQKRIGVDLIAKVLEKLDKLYGRVALDNIPSLKMCFAMGMVGFKVIEGPTGKPTLWLGIGNWKREDVE